MATNMGNPPFRAFFRIYEDGEVIDSLTSLKTSWKLESNEGIKMAQSLMG